MPKCIKADGTELEHEHADHPDYKFQVEIEFIGEKPELPEWDTSYCNKHHALIYSDKYIAVTLYEYRYYVWSLNDGRILMANNYSESGWKLTEESIKKIKES